MGFIPIFLALSLFLVLWGIVVRQSISSEKKKIQAATSDLGLSTSLDSVESKLQLEDSADLRSLKVKMSRYNKLISSYPYKIVAALMSSKKF